jgi:hypothetical protein
MILFIMRDLVTTIHWVFDDLIKHNKEMDEDIRSEIIRYTNYYKTCCATETSTSRPASAKQKFSNEAIRKVINGGGYPHQNFSTKRASSCRKGAKLIAPFSLRKSLICTSLGKTIEP